MPNKSGQVWAIRTRRTKANAWMPDACFVRLEGETKLLLVCGFSIEADETVWKIEQLGRYLPKITKQWREEYGAGWRLEIRETPQI
jgi:hypothetical protein